MPPTLDPAPLREIHGFQKPDAPDLVEELIAVFQTQTNVLIAHMLLTIEQENTTELVFAVHRLRGSCATIGASHMAHLCAEIAAALEQQPTTLAELRPLLAAIEAENANLNIALAEVRRSLGAR